MTRAARIALPLAALAACGAAGVLPALAADQTVTAKSSSFTPSTVALKPGETLTIRHEDGPTPHELKFDDEATPRQTAGTGWTVTRTFGAGEARAQPYGFVCSLHYAMRGRVYVNDTGTIPTAPPPPPPPPPPPGGGTTPPPPPPGGAPAPPPPPGAVTPELRAVSLAGACGPRCVRLRIDLSAPADVRGTLRRRAPGARRFRAFGAVRFGRVAAGPRRLALTRTTRGKRLRPGRYRLALTTAGETRTLAFRIKAAR